MPLNAVYQIPPYFKPSYGTRMILLTDPDSHFSLQKSIDIMEDFLQQRAKTFSPFSKGGLRGI
jgi:hypothetical protein